MLERYLEERSIPEPNTGCWLWLLSLHPKGYGAAWLNGDLWLAHRLSWMIHRGPIPVGLHVLHRCDQPSCINPGHLFLGTNAANMADKISKGRQTRGEKNGPSRLTAELVAAIRADDRPQAVIAAAYGIAQGHVSRLKNRKQWSHV